MKDIGQDVTEQPGRLETQTWILSSQKQSPPNQRKSREHSTAPAPFDLRQHSLPELDSEHHCGQSCLYCPREQDEATRSSAAS